VRGRILPFLPRCMWCRRGIAMRILSVPLSVCLSSVCYLSYVEHVTLWAQTCSHKLRVNYSDDIADDKYPYCIGACLNVTAVDTTTDEPPYRLLTPALIAREYESSGYSMTGTSLHVTEVLTVYAFCFLYCGTLLMSELWYCLILLGVLEVFWFHLNHFRW